MNLLTATRDADEKIIAPDHIQIPNRPADDAMTMARWIHQWHNAMQMETRLAPSVFVLYLLRFFLTYLYIYICVCYIVTNSLRNSQQGFVNVNNKHVLKEKW